MKQIKIHLGPMPRDLSVEIEGQQFADALHSITVRQAGAPRGAEFPRVELELATASVDIEGSARVLVYITDPVRDALVALGWAPPDAATPRDAEAAELVFAALEATWTPFDSAADRERRYAAGRELLGALGFQVPARYRARDPRAPYPHPLTTDEGVTRGSESP